MNEEQAKQKIFTLCSNSPLFEQSMTERLESELEALLTQELCKYYLALYKKEEKVNTKSHLVAYLIGLSDNYGSEENRPFMGDMPDIDVDFSDREPVVQYLREKYGSDHVAYVNNYVTLSGKSAINDVCRVLETSIPKKIKDGVEAAGGAANYLIDEPTLSPEQRKVIGYAAKLENNVRHYSVSAAGVLVSNRPVSDYSGMWYDKGHLISVYDKEDSEKIGFIKMDVLRVVAAVTIDKCLELIKERGGSVPDNIWDIDVDDESILNEFRKTNVDLIFQYKGFTTKALISQLKLNNVIDLIATHALSRPGPDEKEYIKNSELKDINYGHPALEKVLSRTVNVLLYQEQIMAVCREFALMSARDANRVRKMVGKKDIKEAPGLKRIFTRGAKKNGSSEFLANSIWELIMRAGSYSFGECLHPDTQIRMQDGSCIRMQTLSKMHNENPDEDIYLMSMYPDGSVRPNKLKHIQSTGKKNKYQIVLKSSRKVTASANHRFITTEGYKKVSELKIGDEFFVTDRIDGRRVTSKENIKIARNSPAALALSAAGGNIKKYQDSIGFEERSKHSRMLIEKYPEVYKQLGKRLSKTSKDWMEDPENRAYHARRSAEGLSKALIFTHKVYYGWGNHCYASDGTYCYSIAERNMCEHLIQNNISYEPQKVLSNGRPCDFYFGGMYWEMDGMRRKKEFWVKKYGDIPYIVVTPNNYKETIDSFLLSEHVENGDPIVDIIDNGMSEDSFYDIEMADEPRNFILKNGIVSHNSHATAYFITGWVQMYLQVYHPFEWILANLMVAETDDNLSATIKTAMKMGMKFSNAHVNKSKLDWSYEGNTLIPGLNFVSGVGPKAAEMIAENAPYEDEDDMLERLPKRVFNVRVRKVLREAGAIPGIEGDVVKSAVAAGLPVNVLEGKEIHPHWNPVNYSEANGPCVVQAYVKKSMKKGDKYCVYFQSDIPGMGYSNEKIEEGAYLLLVDAKWDSIFGAVGEEKWDKHPSDMKKFKKYRPLLATIGPGSGYVVSSRKINKRYPTMVLSPQPRILWMGKESENGKIRVIEKDEESNLWAVIK